MVALTGWGRNDDRGRTKDAGFDHHLVKPVDPDSLQEVLRAVAETRLHRNPASDTLHGGS
jgi:CheY-like chemotaxis protein